MDLGPTAGGLVRAQHWRLLEQEFRARLGSQAWASFLEEVGAPRYADLPPETRLSAEAFRRALEWLDSHLGQTQPAPLDQFAAAVAAHWRHGFRFLVDQLQGQPEKMLDLFVREIHPFQFGQPNRPTPPAAGERGWSVRLVDELPEPLRRKLLEAFLALTGARASVRLLPDGAYHVAWRLEGEPPTPGAFSLLVATVRLPFLTATIVPVLVGMAIAAQDGSFQPGLGLLTLIGVCCFQFGTTAINDYYDRLTGQRETPHIANPFASRGDRRTRHLPAPAALKRLAYIFYGVGTAVGLFLISRGVEILWLGLAGFLLGFLYSAPPVRLAYRGLGELAVAVGFGPLIVMGTYFVQTQEWSGEAFLASLPLAFTIAAVLYIHEFPDREGDARVGKRTLIVRLPERSAVIGYVVLMALTYVVILGGVVLNGVPSLRRFAFPVWSVLGLLTLPLAIKASVVLSRNYRFPYRLIPANASTVLVHLSTGLLFGLGYLVALVP